MFLRNSALIFACFIPLISHGMSSKERRINEELNNISDKMEKTENHFEDISEELCRQVLPKYERTECQIVMQSRLWSMVRAMQEVGLARRTMSAAEVSLERGIELDKGYIIVTEEFPKERYPAFDVFDDLSKESVLGLGDWLCVKVPNPDEGERDVLVCKRRQVILHASLKHKNRFFFFGKE